MASTQRPAAKGILSNAQASPSSPDQLSSAQLKALSTSQERTSIIFKRSADAEFHYVDYNISLPLAKAFSSFVGANVRHQEQIKIAQQHLVRQGKGTVNITVGDNNCPGFRTDDLARVKQVFQYIRVYTPGRKAVREVGGGSLLEYVRLLDVAEALGVIVLVQALSKKIAYICNSTPPLVQVDELLPFYKPDENPAKYQMVVDALALGAFNERVLRDDPDLERLDRKFPCLCNDIQKSLTRLYQARNRRNHPAKAQQTQRGRAPNGQSQRSVAPSNRSQANHGRGNQPCGGKPQGGETQDDKTEDDDKTQDSRPRGAQNQVLREDEMKSPEGEPGGEAHTPGAQVDRNQVGRRYCGQARVETYAQRAAKGLA